MQIKTAANYNLDLLCFLNVMTADEFFTEIHKVPFGKFYPAVNYNTKQRMNKYTKLSGDTEIASTLALLISSLPGFSEKGLMEMLEDTAGIEQSMNKTRHNFSRLQYIYFFGLIKKVVIPMVDELEGAGFKDFWQTYRLPQITQKCKEIDTHLEQYDDERLISQFKDADRIDGSDFTIYLCSFAKPLRLKLCGNNIITDFSYDNDTILLYATHEAFHPPYDVENVKSALDALSQKPWVKKAYRKQRPMRHAPMSVFIEENIVEALGVYVSVRLGVDIDPKEHFEKHDEGSHVISPYFYDYLCEKEIAPSQSFEDYFNAFVESLGAVCGPQIRNSEFGIRN